MRDMHWFVYVEDFNGRKISEYDIFEHYSFAEDVKKAYKRHRNDFEAFAKEVRGALAYCFWSKCEYETVISSWVAPERVKPRKVDAYEQVMLNWDVFVRYVWEQAHARKRRNLTENGKEME